MDRGRHQRVMDHSKRRMGISLTGGQAGFDSPDEIVVANQDGRTIDQMVRRVSRSLVLRWRRLVAASGSLAGQRASEPLAATRQRHPCLNHADAFVHTVTLYTGRNRVGCYALTRR